MKGGPKVKAKHTPYWSDVLYVKAPARVKAGGAPFSEEEQQAAGGWVTCACGAQDDGIPRNRNSNAPEDAQLIELGCEFDMAIYDYDVRWARKTLAAIERRAAIVLRELEASRSDVKPKGGYGGAA